MLLNYKKEVLRLGAIYNISIMLKPNMHLGYRSLQNKTISNEAVCVGQNKNKDMLAKHLIHSSQASVHAY
jgi:hypothetical protein